MMTDPDRAQVLKMIDAGQISADEGLRLLNAVGAAPPGAASLSGRWLRIRVTDLATQRPKVNVNLPLTWVSLGLKIGSRYSDDLAKIDMNEVMTEIERGAQGRIIDVEDVEDGERVEIYVD